MVSADSNVAGNADTAPISVGADTEAKNVQNEDDQPTDLGVTLRRWISGVWGGPRGKLPALKRRQIGQIPKRCVRLN